MTIVIALVLFALACLGHLVLMVGHHNWWYGSHLPKWAGGVVHFGHGLLVVALPIGLQIAWGFPPEGAFDPANLSTPLAPLTLYLWLCVLVGAVWAPAVTIVRCRRRDAATEVRAEVVDVARQLGRRPVGEGHTLLAHLPGTEIFHIEYSEKTLRPERLPAAWDGLTILHLSDLHLHGTPDKDYFRVILDRCASWMPDIVAITGDVADSPIHHRWIVPLLGRLRWRIAAFAILGNHDHYFDVPLIRRRLRKLRMHVPENRFLETTVRGEPLVVIGHEGPWLQPAPDLSSCPSGPFRLCLSHTPDNIAWARRNGIDLMLSGHVHGGQIRFPVVGSLLVPSRYGRRFDGGTFQESGTLLHVSRGVSGEHPVRYNCLPEATLITLRCPGRE
jgi:predicted MPP superfamily phosphohydrolase